METIILIILCFSLFVLSGITLLTVLHYVFGKKRIVTLSGNPRVSILKPISTVVDDLEKNMESFFNLKYSNYEILFGVENINSEYVKILNNLKKKYPNIRTEIIETGSISTQNPKISSLSKLEKYCTGSLYWIVDANIRVKNNVLESMVNEYLVNGSKMIFSPIRGIGGRTIGSMIENSNTNIFISGVMIMAWSLFRRQVITGKSVLIEKESLESFGGFSYFKEYVAEDFIMGETFDNSHFKISTNYAWVDGISERSTIKKIFNRLARWAKLRFHLKRYIYFLEIFLNPIIISSVGALIYGGVWVDILIITVITKVFLEYIVFVCLNDEDRKYPILNLLFLVSVVIKDIISFVVYFIPFFSHTIIWSNKKISIGKNTIILHLRKWFIRYHK
ncbi:MAG: glycosyltransferase [Elusimicrobia bacterium]|nr:glycosyltransferase [Elusimicrobiota bacterium]